MTSFNNEFRTILKPGDLVFNNGSTMLSTLLGSCVSVVLWHPLLRIGGMCHFLLPKRNRDTIGPLSGLYADEAMLIFKHKIEQLGTRPQEYLVRLYGGANMFPDHYQTCTDSGQIPSSLCESCPSSRISCHNCHAAFSQSKKHGFLVKDAELGGNVCRTITLNTVDGTILIRATEMTDLNTKTEQQLLGFMAKTGKAS